MKMDWHYITEERAQANIRAAAVESIMNIANEGGESAEVFNAKIKGVLMLMGELLESLEEAKDET